MAEVQAEDVKTLETEMKELSAQVVRLTTLIGREGELCPHRERIAKAANNDERLGTLENRVRATEMRLAVISGISGGGVAGAIMVIGKMVGWIGGS